MFAHTDLILFLTISFWLLFLQYSEHVWGIVSIVNGFFNVFGEELYYRLFQGKIGSKLAISRPYTHFLYFLSPEKKP